MNWTMEINPYKSFKFISISSTDFWILKGKKLDNKVVAPYYERWQICDMRGPELGPQHSRPPAKCHLKPRGSKWLSPKTLKAAIQNTLPPPPL